MSDKLLVQTAKKAVEDWVILRPDLPAHALAVEITEGEQGDDSLSELAQGLLVQYLIRLIYQERARQAKKQQLRLPGFEEIPSRISTADGHRPALLKATLTQLKSYLGVLYKKRYRDNPRVQQLKRLIALIQPHARKNAKITVGSVLGSSV